jgi:hypothetical protein
MTVISTPTRGNWNADILALDVDKYLHNKQYFATARISAESLELALNLVLEDWHLDEHCSDDQYWELITEIKQIITDKRKEPKPHHQQSRGRGRWY